jgi:hypothetical protein
MLLSELFDKVETSGSLEGVGISETDRGPQLLIKHKPTGISTMLPADAVSDLTWDQLEPVLLGVRSPVVLTHISRVVGYFSRIENWNKSKLGELKDRHKGSYAIADQA